jgi:hypothetical protein
MTRIENTPDAAPCLTLSDGDLRLGRADLLLDQRFDSASLPEGWHVETGRWTPTPDGLLGSIDEDSAAVVWCGQRFPDEVALVMEAQAMPGHDNDANAFFRAAGSIYGGSGGDRDRRRDCGAWIVGTAGWYVADHGLERHPEGPTWRVEGEPLEANRTVRVVAGYRAGRVFLWKDGRLWLAGAHPQPNATGAHDRVGLGTWNSAIRFRRLSVYGIGKRGIA